MPEIWKEIRMNDQLPVVVIGSGPIGLAAAAHLVQRNVPVALLEAESCIAPNLRDWGHVWLFSIWEQCVDAAAVSLLKRNGWAGPPSQGLPTGSDLVTNYLEPLARTPELAKAIRTNAKVIRITREGLDRMSSKDRPDRPFVVHLDDDRGNREALRASAVIDASGTWQNPNPLGADGWPADNEDQNSGFIRYGIPDASGADRRLYAGKRTLVVGGGHSAANALLDLALLAEQEPATAITWAVRGSSLTKVFGGGNADQLPARGELGNRLRALTDSGRLNLVMPFAAHRIDNDPEGLMVEGWQARSKRRIGPFDRIVAATGQRPDFSFSRELQLDLDPAVESTRQLGPLIDPSQHSCGTVPPHGWRELAHPEPGYFIAGIKSYGRAPTFLLLTGYEQVRSIAAHLAGDHAAADETRLVLPETGVCNAPLEAVVPGGLCCTGAAADAAVPCCERPARERHSPCCSTPSAVERERVARCC
jgi:thioredoxin reductase